MTDADEHAWLERLRGRLLVFEGPDGSGKTTQFARFVRRCTDAGLQVCEVREPGGTEIGERIREILLDTRSQMNPRCEMLLFMASRAQLMEERIRPALAAGEVVLADRFVTSTIAYQGALGVDEADILAAARAACGEIRPDLVLVFDVDESAAAARIVPGRDRIERRDADHRALVRERYLAQVRKDPAGHALIDAMGGADEVERETIRVLRARLG